MKPCTNTPIILIVDDMLTNIQILVESLKSKYRIKVSNNGEEALLLAMADPQPDLILLDIMMPVMDGFEVCRLLKSNPKTQSIPIIFITAKDNLSDEEHGLNLGAVDYIIKPFHIPVVAARIRNHIKLKNHADMLENLAQIDPLTHLPNRRRINEVLQCELKRADRDHSFLALLMIDIDHFKEYNDHYGHGQGDICLQAVASALAEGLTRAGDMVGRYGGEEFIAILPNSGKEDACHVAERLKTKVSQLNVPHQFSSTEAYVTVSIGAASLDENDLLNKADTLLEAADKQLYLAKQTGRNRVCC
ncbi:MAG: diguanylate cyclase [Methylicorpusculum sp.]|uniref:GGDEF domain-containing response regulator n=1 Tax=Methylicorpusculum sp. TaxID=2713644 RepID=UPI0027283B63|nr:diguanylate cyclase [Methylicorpusculum sp.]MDO8845755.1 diguanylate cyclase [Methylicorpusculum sp.]MDO8941452.1 diguanylate cyclase [Methylicorpusculum sp.]MDP2204333.1 diguanylate cyclase [Methylicorpusculum sp.]